MNNRLLESIQFMRVSVPLSTTEAAPVMVDLDLFDDTIAEVSFWASTSDNIGVMLTDNGTPILPTTGYIIVPTNVINMRLERQLQGPPYVLRAYLINSNVAAKFFNMLVQTKSSKEVDLDTVMVQELKRIREILEK